MYRQKLLRSSIVVIVLLVALAGCAGGPAATPSPSSPPVAATTTLPPPTPTPAPGDARTDAYGVDQLWVPAGTFLMGTADASELDPPVWAARELQSEQPQHEVEITSGYWIDRYEVTNAAYQAFVEDGGYAEQEYWSDEGWAWLQEQDEERPVSCVEEVPDHPRVCITWYEAQAYAHWRGGRLPTEAEWEYAARGPESLIYPWGDSFDATKTNVVDSSGLVPVGSYPDGVSWVGAHDMAGNAMEWVKDWLNLDYYERRIRVDPQGPENGRIKIEKGGWWGSNPYVARAAYRHFEDPPTYQDHHIGFRIVTPAEAPREGLGRGVAERPSVQVRNVPPLIVWPWTSVPRRYGFESRAAARAHVIRQVIQIDRGAPTLLLAPAAG